MDRQRLFFGPVVELVTMPRCQRVWMSVRVRPGPQIRSIGLNGYNA